MRCELVIVAGAGRVALAEPAVDIVTQSYEEVDPPRVELLHRCIEPGAVVLVVALQVVESVAPLVVVGALVGCPVTYPPSSVCILSPRSGKIVLGGLSE